MEEEKFMKSITILPRKGCRRSKKVMAYLQEHDIPFKTIALESPQGEALMERHQFLASPGILVDGDSINPYDILIQEKCQIDEENLREIFGLNQNT